MPLKPSTVMINEDDTYLKFDNDEENVTLIPIDDFKKWHTMLYEALKNLMNKQELRSSVSIRSGRKKSMTVKTKSSRHRKVLDIVEENKIINSENSSPSEDNEKDHSDEKEDLKKKERQNRT